MVGDRKRWATKLEVLSASAKDGVLSVTLARLDQRGGVPGRVYYTDAEPEGEDPGAQRYETPTDGHGIVRISFAYGLGGRKVTFFLPENPEVKVEIMVPAKPKPWPEIPKPPGEEPDYLTRGRKAARKFLEKIAEAYRRGRT